MENNVNLEEKDFIKIENELSTESISVDTYLDYFFKINTAVSKEIVKNPIRLYLALRNANVVVNGNELDNKIAVYSNVINTVNYLISFYAKEYINVDYDLNDYSSSLKDAIDSKGFITFDVFKDAYYLFELYVLAGINGSDLFDFVNLLNGIYVRTDDVNEIIDLTNMKNRLSSYVKQYSDNKKLVK